MDDFEFAVDPNCPQCLKRMQLVVGGWCCEECREILRPTHLEWPRA
jgi:tRNA(Ile2) C34 agmatinyltransferase TiaS